MDSIGNSPAHALIVHAAVVLIPLVSVGLLVYVAFPSWRVGLRWPLLILALGGAGSTFAAAESGEYLQARLRSIDNTGEVINTHVDAGLVAGRAGLILLVGALLVILVLARVGKEATRLSTALAFVVVLAVGGYSSWLVYQAGHSGSGAVWDGLIENTTVSE
jgi:hypothetical protein